MAFEPLIKEPPVAAEPAATPQPDPTAQAMLRLAEELNAAYRANKGFATTAAAPQIQYVPYPVAPQQEPQQLTEAEVLADIPKAVRDEAERIAAQREAALREELGGHLSQIYAKDFDRDIRELSQQPYFKFVEDELKAHFVNNPQDKFVAGRLKEKYDQLVGSRLDQILSEKEKTDDSVLRGRAVDHAIPVATSPLPARTSSKEEPEPDLGPEREELRQFFNQTMGLNMSKKEWLAIESRKELAPTWDSGRGATPPIGAGK